MVITDFGESQFKPSLLTSSTTTSSARKTFVDSFKLVKTADLEKLQDCKIGISAFDWLKKYVFDSSVWSEKILFAHGGHPLTALSIAQKEIEKLKQASITPLFVFEGFHCRLHSNKSTPTTTTTSSKPATMTPTTSLLGSDEERRKKFASGLGQQQQPASPFATNLVSPFPFSNTLNYPLANVITDFYPLLMHYFSEQGIEFIRAPYLAYGQLKYLYDQNEIQGIFASDEMLMFPSMDRLILDIQVQNNLFKYIEMQQIYSVLRTEICQKVLKTDVSDPELYTWFLDTCTIIGSYISPALIPTQNIKFLGLYTSVALQQGGLPYLMNDPDNMFPSTVHKITDMEQKSQMMEQENALKRDLAEAFLISKNLVLHHAYLDQQVAKVFLFGDGNNSNYSKPIPFAHQITRQFANAALQQQQQQAETNPSIPLVDPEILFKQGEFAPTDMSDVIGFKLPNALYILLAQGVLSTHVVNNLLTGTFREPTPWLHSLEYDMTSNTLFELRRDTFVLLTNYWNVNMSHALVSFYKWNDTQHKVAEFPVLLSELPNATMPSVKFLYSIDRPIQYKKESLEMQSQFVTLQQLCSAKPFIALGQPSANQQWYSNAMQLEAQVLCKFLEFLHWFEKPNKQSKVLELNPLGKCMSRATVFANETLLALQLIQHSFLHARTYATIAEQQIYMTPILLISRVASLLPLIEQSEKPWVFRVDYDLIQFNSVVMSYSKAYRNLLETILAVMTMKRKYTQNMDDIVQVGYHLPYLKEGNTLVGIIVKYILEGGLEQVAQRMATLPSVFPTIKNMKQILSQVVMFWNQLYDMVMEMSVNYNWEGFVQVRDEFYQANELMQQMQWDQLLSTL